MSTSDFFMILGGDTDISTPPPPTSEDGTGRFFTQSDLTRWVNNFNQGYYEYHGKHFSNSPGKWNDLYAGHTSWMNSNSYSSRNSSQPYEIYAPQRDQLSNGNYWQRGQTISGQGPFNTATPCWAEEFFHINSRNRQKSPILCAFYGLIEGNTSKIQLAINHLVKATENPQMNFAAYAHWYPNISTDIGQYTDSRSWQTNPFFYIGELAVQYAWTADLVWDYLSELQRYAIVLWLFRMGHFLAENIYGGLYKAAFDGTVSGTYIAGSDPLNYTYTTYKSYASDPTSSYTHDGGYRISRLGGLFNNRACSQMAGIMACGLFCLANDNYLTYYHSGGKYSAQRMVDFAKNIFKDYIKYHIFTDGTSSEWYRGAIPGQYYFGVMAHSMANTAHMYYKVLGDSELFDYSTTDGLTGTNGATSTTDGVTSKNLELFAEGYLKYYRSTSVGGFATRYVSGQEITGESGGKYEQDLSAALILYDYYNNDKWWNYLNWTTSNGYDYGWKGSATRQLGSNYWPTHGVQGNFPELWFMYGPNPNTLVQS